MKKVNITIKGGKVSQEYSGFVGKSCEVLAKQIEPDGLEIEEKNLKPEYHYNTRTTSAFEKNRN